MIFNSEICLFSHIFSPNLLKYKYKYQNYSSSQINAGKNQVYQKNNFFNNFNISKEIMIIMIGFYHLGYKSCLFNLLCCIRSPHRENQRRKRNPNFENFTVLASKFFWIKGTVSVILSELPFKEGHFRFTRVPDNSLY